MSRSFAMTWVVGALLVAIVATTGPGCPAPPNPPEPPEFELESPQPALVARLRELTEAVHDDPGSADAWGQLAICYDVHKLLPQAVQCYRRAAALDPSDFRWPYFLGFCLELGDRSAAIAQHRRAAALRPDYAPLQVYLGRALLANEQLDQARSCFEKAIESDPALIGAHLGLAEIALLRDEPEAALAHLARAQRLGPKGGLVYAYLAEAQRRLGNLEAAEMNLARAGRPVLGEPVPDPVRRKWQYEAGVTVYWRRLRSENFLAEGRPDRAIDEWRALLSAEAGVAEAHEQIGRIHHISNRVAEAIAEYERTLELDPDRHMIRNTLGALLVRTGQVDRGFRLMREACAKLPGNPRAHLNLALALRDFGKTAEAIELLEHVLEAQGDHLEARFQYGVVLARAGRLDEAAVEFSRVAEVDPAWPGLKAALRGVNR